MTMRRPIAALLLAVALLPAGVARAQQPAGSAANERYEIPASLLAWVDELFSLPPAAEPLDTEVRAAAGELRTLALDQMKVLSGNWIAEERALATDTYAVDRIENRVMRRIVNELALWRVDPVGGTELDAAELALWRGDGACVALDGGSVFHTVLRMLQRAAPQQRPRLLVAERQRVQRWGTARPVALAAPLPSAYAAQEAMLQRVLAGAAVADQPWPPLLSRYMTTTDEWHDKRRDHRFMRCLKAQWWLQSGAQAHDALTLLRHAQVLRADEWWPAQPQRPGSDYPPLAAMLEVTGAVTVGADIDAEGRVLRAAVVSRQIEVAGVRGNVPLAFEALLDGPSAERLLGQTIAKPRPDQLKDGVARDVRVELNWRLE